MSILGNQLVAAEQADIARCIRHLLARPLITADTDPELFELVCRRQTALVRWFDYNCGWTLAVEPRLGYVRLIKMHAEVDGSRPARRQRSGRAAFDRRRYALLCVVAAELVAGPSTTIGLLADRVVQATAADPVVPAFDTAVRVERMAYVDVLRLLESYGVVRAIDGSTDSFVDSADAKVLYRVDPTLLMRLLAVPHGPSQLDIPAESGRFDELLDGLRHEPRYGTSQDRSDTRHNLWMRHSVLRKLVEQPVVYWADLTEAQRGYLASPTGRQIMRLAADQAGFVLEERAEGVLLVDTDAIATDSKFPDDAAHAKVAALILLDSLNASTGMTDEQLHSRAESLLREWPNWGKTYRSDGGTQRLIDDALAVLFDFGLARRDGALVLARPAAARYSLVHTSDGGNA